MKHRFVNMYITATISVALVLFLIGIECVVMLSTHQLIRDLKENVTLTILVKESADSIQMQRLGELIQSSPYCHQLQFISKQQALEEHIADLGENPVEFLGYNPLSNSYEVQLNAPYAAQDSILQIEEQLMLMPSVSAVNHPQEIVSVLDMHVAKISLALVIVALVLFLISLVLIINTVRLQVYSKRFIIHTMCLVGATSWVIRAPFIQRNLRMGLEAAILALLAVAATLYLVHMRLGLWLIGLSWQNAAIITGVVILSGEIITFLAAMIATGRYIRMKTDKMYEI